MRTRGLRIVLAAAVLAAAVAGAVTIRAASTPADLVKAALSKRLGPAVDVTVVALDGVPEGLVFREARPDPSARLGRPIRVALVRDRGPAVWITATVRAIGDQVVMRRALERGATIEAGDVEARRSELTAIPLRALPRLADAVGARATRALRAGEALLPGAVVTPPAIEAGDRVTVVASVGAVEVTATFVASDRGAPGDVIRVVNPETRRVVRGRVVRKGLVEVIYEK